MSTVFGTNACVENLGFTITYILVYPIQPVVKSLQYEAFLMIVDTGFLTM